MPYPTRIDRETTIATARDLIEQHGVEWLSLAKLAEQLGVKAPSLYRHFDSKAVLLKAINELALEELIAALNAVPADDDVRRRLSAMADVWRAFAQRCPNVYMLLYGRADESIRPDADHALRLALPLQALVGQFAGAAASLAALRGIYALMHGFVMLELAGQFRRGGDLDAHYAQIIRAYIDGWRI
ncbi:MAG: TetR/AcrR family transcriptional regulator [Chloroflexota bacterium]|nr:TetR/AcrR family transcriptional regulator [Chloroflexota bacterium]